MDASRLPPPSAPSPSTPLLRVAVSAADVVPVAETPLAPRTKDSRALAPQPSAPLASAKTIATKKTVARPSDYPLELQGRKHALVVAHLAEEDFARLERLPDEALVREIHRSALLRLGYPEAALEELTYPTALVQNGVPLDIAAVRAWIASPDNGSVTVRQDLRQLAYIATLGSPRAIAAFKRDCKLDAELAEVDAYFRERMNAAGTLLQRSFVMVDWQSAKKAAVDVVLADAGEVRSQNGFSVAADTP